MKANLEPIQVLFADDEPDMHQLIGVILKYAGMRVDFAANGLQALEKWQQTIFDLIILDVMMPVMDGVEACRRMRRISEVPIILLTAKGLEQDVVAGLQAGADDYIVKPFRPKEFVARIHNLLKRSGRRSDSRSHAPAYEDLVLDMDSQRVVYRGRSIQVTPLEFRLLRYLLQNAGTVLSKEDLLQHVWGYVEPVGEFNLIETAIRRLRIKIESDPSRPQFIQTVWGAGYRLGD